MFEVKEVHCPLCGSGEVRGFKNKREDGLWEHQCVSNIEHGFYTDNNSKYHKFDKNPWFKCDGKVFTAHGLMQFTWIGDKDVSI